MSSKWNDPNFKKEYNREWMEKNKDKVKKYREKVRDRMIKESGTTYKKDYYIKHKDIFSKSQNKWLEKNKESQSEYHKNYYDNIIKPAKVENNESFNDYIKEYQKEYYSKNRERILSLSKLKRLINKSLEDRIDDLLL